jgi:hypothetical protein
MSTPSALGPGTRASTLERTFLAAALAVVCLLAMAVLSFVGTHRSKVTGGDDQYRVVQTPRPLQKLDNASDDLIHMRASQRNYVQSGENSYLFLYNTNLDHFRDDLSHVAGLIFDNFHWQLARHQLSSIIAQTLSDLRERFRFSSSKGRKNYTAAMLEQHALPELTTPVTQISEEAKEPLMIQRSETDNVKSWRLKAAIILNVMAVLFLCAAELVVHSGARNRIKIERELFESENTFRRMITSLKDYAIFMLDREGHVISWNLGAERIERYRAEEIIGRHFSAFYPHDDVLTGEPEQDLRTAIREGRVEDKAWRVRKDGSRFWANVVITSLWDGGGNLKGFSNVTQDITDRKQAEDALRRGEERYRSLVAATSQLIWSTDPTGKVIEDLPTWRKFTGQSVEEIQGLGWTDAIHDDDRQLVMEARADAAKTLSPYKAECRLRRTDGEYRHVLDCGVPVLGEEGTIREWIGTCSDITDQKQLEEKLRQAQKMEAMGRLAGGISHDFNNLLGVIIGYSDLVLASLSADDLLLHRIEEIKKAGYRAASLTRQLLAFSRNQVLRPRVLDLNVVVAEAGKMLLCLLGEDIELIIRPGVALHYVKADPTQIEQVIVNLAINARDAMPKGGKLVIETANTQMDQRYSQRKHDDVQPGNYVLLTVSDTGIGMDNKTEARIFEPFFTTKESGKGTGLGLATVYGIVKQSGGYIWVYSEIGIGTTFRVYIPRTEETLAEIQLKLPVAPHCGTGTILLVEDEDSLRELGRRLIESMGYTVIEAANGADAISLAGQCTGTIRLLVTDVVMPGMDGRELAELLMASRPQMKVLFVSGYPNDAILHYATLKPGVVFLEKPFTRDELGAKIEEVIGASNGPAEKSLGAYR